MATNDAPKREYKELGVLWSRTKQNSTERYLTGKLNLKDLGIETGDISVIIFSNKHKTKDTHPDLRIYLSDRPNTAPTPSPAKGAKPTAKPAAKPAAKAAPASEPEDNQLI